MKRLALLFLAVSALPQAARAQAPAPVAPPWNGDSFALFQGLYGSRLIHLEVPSGPCERAAERLAAVLRAKGEFEVSLAPEACPPGAVRVRVGSPSDPELASLARACGIEPFEEGGFRAFERDYREPGDAAVAVYQDPRHSGLPVCLVLGNDKELVARYLDELPRLSRPHLWVHADGELAFECALGPSGRPRLSEAHDYLARREQYFASGPHMVLENLVVQAGGEPDAERWRAYRAALVLARRRVLGWFESEQAPAVEVFLYDHLEDFERCVGTSALSVPNRLRPRVHVLLSAGVPDDAGQGLARVLARAVAGEPAEAWLEDGLALSAAGSWWGRPLDAWIGHLASGNLLPGPVEILSDAAGQGLSEHVLLPARALLFRSAALGAGHRAGQRVRGKRAGKDAGKEAGKEVGKVLAQWKGAELNDRRLATQFQNAALEAATNARLGPRNPTAAPSRPRAPGGSRRSATQEPPRGSPPSPQTPRAAGPARRVAALSERDARLRERVEALVAAPFRHGLALLAGEAAGYSTRALDTALTEASALGSGPDAVSLTVFGTVEDPLPPACTLFPRAVHGSASDAALANACATARARELRVLLALEVLSGPSGAWADNISWSGAGDSPEFFERTTRVSLHYALLAELLGIEVFSLGANLREATRTDPRGPVRDPALFEQRRKGWKSLIARLRKAFGGGLTYTVHFPSEGHETGFLEELDFLAISLYPRLAQATRDPGDEDLRRALRFELQQALDLAVRWNKPLLIVQLGFPARAESWSTPTLPRGALDLAAQQRFYAALADVLAGPLANKSVLRGFFLWNWPLDQRLAGAREAGFGLRGKPLEAALERLFAR